MMDFMVNTNEAHHILYNMLTVLYILHTVFVQYSECAVSCIPSIRFHMPARQSEYATVVCALIPVPS